MILHKGDDACKYHISSHHPKAIFEALIPGVPKVLLLHPKPSFGLSLDINQVASITIKNAYLRPSEVDPQEQDAKSADYTVVEFCVYLVMTLLYGGGKRVANSLQTHENCFTGLPHRDMSPSASYVMDGPGGYKAF